MSDAPTFAAVGALLLTDLTVMKIMHTAILVGSAGIFSMRALGLVKLHGKPTRYAANTASPLIRSIRFCTTARKPAAT